MVLGDLIGVQPTHTFGQNLDLVERVRKQGVCGLARRLGEDQIGNPATRSTPHLVIPIPLISGNSISNTSFHYDIYN